MIAISQESITLGGKGGIKHSEGLSAVLEGFMLIGFSLLGVLPFLAGNGFRRLLTVLIFISWFIGSIVYLIYFR